jgi:bisphosphoglycerate-dependent phosphoglycerate mutase
MSEELSAQQMLDSVATETGGNTPSPESAAGSGATPPQQAAKWWEPQLKNALEYTVEGGKLVNEPLEMVLKRAGMGYHYAQKMHQLNQKAEQYKTLEERNKTLSRWEEYDNYAKTNPDWAKHVEESWNNRQNVGQLTQEAQAAQLPPAVVQRISALEAFVQEAQQREAAAKQQTEDKSFSEEIQNVGKTFNVDLAQADEHGRSLEWRILEHMEKMGLDGTRPGHFRAAFKDFYYDNLIGREKEQVKENYVKEQVDLKKAGIRSISRSPKGQFQEQGYRPGMSQGEIDTEALNFIKAQMKF